MSMKKNDYKLLILGNFESVYIVQFVKHLKETNPNVHLYFWGYTRDISDADRSFLSCYDDYYLFDLNHSLHASFAEKIKSVVQIRKHFKKFVAGKNFDCINIHYIKPDYFFILDYLKKSATKLILTPWGSDVYWPKGLYKYMVKKIFDAADYTTGADDRFTADYKKIFKVPDKKMVFCNLGVEAIEYIVKHKNEINVEEAKRQLGVGGNYVITCGYKAMKSHRHKEMIEAIYKVRNELPSNLLLFLPLTYPHDEEYIEEVRQEVKEHDLKAVIFDKFLDIPHLFLLRQATDMFIHVQDTDASCASLREYLLCEKKIINGAWLYYPELIKNGSVPFYEVSSLENLSQAIIDAYKSEPIRMEDELIAFLKEKQWKVRIHDWDNLFSGKKQN